METNTKPEYQELYDKFITEYRRGVVSGEEVGETIVRMAGVYAQYNMAMVNADRALSKVACENANKMEETGKAISIAKAEIITDATEQSFIFKQQRAHLQNIEQYINSLKALQKGVLQEYATSSM